MNKIKLESLLKESDNEEEKYPDNSSINSSLHFDTPG